MRFELFIGGACAAGIALAAVACSSSDSSGATPEGEDGGETNTSSSGGGSSGASSSGGSSGTSSSGGSSGTSTSGGITITPKELKAGGALLLGTTVDDQAIYLTLGGATSDIEAVPLAGGASVKVATDFDIQKDVFVISGSAVGWWTQVTNSIGTFNVWSKAAGAKTSLNATSAAGIFAASDDGARIAFSVGADADSSDLAVVDTANAAAVTTGIFALADEINLAALGGATPTCGLEMEFVGKKLFTAHCTGTSATATDARVFVVPDGTTTEVRLDNKGTAAGVIQPFWLADAAGNKLFVIGPTPAATGRVIDLTNIAAVTSAALEDGTARAGFVTKDGSAVVYRTATGGLKRATAGAVPAPKTLVAGAKSFIEESTDQTRMLFRMLDSTSAGSDIRSADTTTENQTPKDLVATATAQALGLTGSGAHAVYVVSAGGTSIALKSQPAAGGTEKELAKDVDTAALAPEGDGVVVLEKGVAQGQLTLYEVRYVNAATGVASAKITDGVPDTGFALTKKKLVYTRIATMGAGLFVADLP